MPSAVTPSACSNGAAIAPYEFKASGDIDGYGYKQEAITTLQGCKDKCCQENQCQAIQFSATAVDGAERQCVLHNNAGDFNPSAGLYQDYHVHIRPAPLSASWMLPYAIDSCIVGPSGYGIFGRDSNGQGRPGGSMHLAETCDSPTHMSQGSDTCIEANADAGSQDSCMPGTVCRRRKISDNGEDACGIEALHNDPQACNALGCCHHNDQNGRCWSSVGQGDCFSEKKCVPVNRALEVMGVFADRARLLRARDAYCSSPNAGAASHQPIGTWDVTNIPDLSNLFCASDCTNDRCQGCNPTCADFNEAIGRWDVSGATNMEGMFRDASSFNQPLTEWKIDRVETMANAFVGADSFSQPKADVPSKFLHCLTDSNQQMCQAQPSPSPGAGPVGGSTSNDGTAGGNDGTAGGNNGNCAVCHTNYNQALGVNCHESEAAYIEDPASCATSTTNFCGMEPGYQCPNNMPYSFAYTCGEAFDNYQQYLPSDHEACQFYRSNCQGCPGVSQ